METLIVILFALIAAVLLEAVYTIAVSLARWAPILVAGILGGWAAGALGASHAGAWGLGALAAVAARRLLRHAF
ncbi:MAG: hypothetical protein R3C25_14840 [Hyphomonadaceae bacterium]